MKKIYKYVIISILLFLAIPSFAFANIDSKLIVNDDLKEYCVISDVGTIYEAVIPEGWKEVGLRNFNLDYYNSLGYKYSKEPLKSGYKYNNKVFWSLIVIPTPFLLLFIYVLYKYFIKPILRKKQEKLSKKSKE